MGFLGYVDRMARPGSGGDERKLTFDLTVRLLILVENLDKVLVAKTCRSLNDLNAVSFALFLQHVVLILDHLIDPEGQIGHGDFAVLMAEIG